MTVRRTLQLTAAGLALAASLTAVPAPAPAHALDPAVPLWEQAGAGLSVSGRYRPIVGDFGNPTAAGDDILWYAPGSAADHLWLSNGDATFEKVAPPQVDGTYTPIVGDFAGDGLDDIVWYAPGAAPDWLWTSTGAGFTPSPLSISGTWSPVVLDDLVGKDDIVWAREGGGAGHVWTFTAGGAFATRAITSPAGSRPVVGHFSPGPCGDVFWYAPGPAPDALWWMDCTGAAITAPQTVNGTYQPVVVDLRGDGAGVDEILWYRSGAPSAVWTSTSTIGTWSTESVTIPVAGRAIPVRGLWGLVHLWSTTGPDLAYWTDGPTDGPFLGPVASAELPAGSLPLVGRFVGGTEGIFWYRPGPGAERLFHQHP